jgi:ankyrin repeat protein
LIAAFEGNSAIVKQLIKAGADIHHINATDNTPLMLAVSVGHIATVRELLHAGAKPTGCGTNREKALAWATEQGDIDMVRILIEAGADVQSTHPDGRNALSFAAERGHIEICKMLVQAGSEIDSVDMLGRTALSWAAEHGSIDQFIYLWQLDPQLGQTDRFGRSPLSWAAEKGHNDIISFIISQRAPLDITHKGNWDVELISDAIRKLHPSTFKLLPPFRSPWQFRREDAATLQRPACNPLGIAVAQGHAQAVKTLLDAGAATDIKDITGFTPLMLAAKRGDLHVVSLLVSAGASLDRKCQRGWDAAKLASASGHRYVAFYLNLERGRMRYTSQVCNGSNMGVSVFVQHMRCKYSVRDSRFGMLWLPQLVTILDGCGPTRSLLYVYVQ